MAPKFKYNTNTTQRGAEEKAAEKPAAAARS